MNHDITNEVLTEFSTAFSSNPVNRIAMNAVTSAGLLAASKNPMAQRESRHSYSISLEQGEITNQKQSGRCWMFAALNTFRFEVMKNLNLKTFELSQNYTLFYDKLEKSNYFLESILETLDEPTQGRLISFLLSAPLGDGGQWDMLCNLVRKYGVVPKEAMPETVSSSATREMTSALTRKLREDACRLRSPLRSVLVLPVMVAMMSPFFTFSPSWMRMSIWNLPPTSSKTRFATSMPQRTPLSFAR